MSLSDLLQLTLMLNTIVSLIFQTRQLMPFTRFQSALKQIILKSLSIRRTRINLILSCHSILKLIITTLNSTLHSLLHRQSTHLLLLLLLSFLSLNGILFNIDINTFLIRVRILRFSNWTLNSILSSGRRRIRRHGIVLKILIPIRRLYINIRNSLIILCNRNIILNQRQFIYLSINRSQILHTFPMHILTMSKRHHSIHTTSLY